MSTTGIKKFQNGLESIAEENNISSEVMEEIIGLCKEYFEPNDDEQRLLEVCHQHGYKTEQDADRLDEDLLEWGKILKKYQMSIKTF